MKQYFSLSDRTDVPCVVALGCFDGVHLGHRAVIQTAKQLSALYQCATAVWTFSEPPKNFFQPGSVPLITDGKAKARLMESLGVEHLFSVPFGESVAALSPRQFFEDVLLRQLQAKHLVCGYNYTFGAGGAGTVDTLRALCREAEIGLSVLPPVTVDELPVSSSVIRSALEEGNPQLATAALGRPYSLCAPVIGGQRLARNLGFPTVNQEFPKGTVIPRRGVYAVQVTLPHEATPFFGISNVGLRPTVGGSLLCCETHIFEFEGDLYDTPVTVEFLSFLREEQKFSSLEKLTAQVTKDINQAKEILQKISTDNE